MILDSSALVAILAQEPDADLYIQAISRAQRCRISAGTFIEVSRQCDALFRRIGIVIEPVTVEQAHLARQGFLDFGKGRHPAGLNFGDCFAYALAKNTGDPLLCKGEDFKKTDIVSAL